MSYEVNIKDKVQEIHEIIEELEELKRLINLIKSQDYEIHVKKLKKEENK